MIVTNKFRVEIKMKLLLVLLIFDIFFTIGWITFLPPLNHFIKWLLFIVSLSLFIITIKYFTNLKVFHFENTGMLFSVRHYHPLKKGNITPIIEYPVNRFQSLKIENASPSSSIIIFVIITKEKKRRFHIKVSGISNQELKLIEKSLSHS